MKYFIAVIDKDSDSAYGATFPDIEGCFSGADKEKDLVPNCIEALNLWSEYCSLPRPMTIDEVRTIDWVKESLADGAYLISIPFIQKHHKPTKVTISIDKGIVEAIDATAKQHGMTRSAFIADAAQRQINN